jgi:hypothetical protein
MTASSYLLTPHKITAHAEDRTGDQARAMVVHGVAAGEVGC